MGELGKDIYGMEEPVAGVYAHVDFKKIQSECHITFQEKSLLFKLLRHCQGWATFVGRKNGDSSFLFTRFSFHSLHNKSF